MEKESLTEFIGLLKQSKKAIIVEGIKDKKALESLSIKNIFVLNKKPIFEVVENLAKNNKEAIILTDLDKEGKKLYGKIFQELKRNRIKVDRYFREWLQKNTKLSHIEGLETYINKNN